MIFIFPSLLTGTFEDELLTSTWLFWWIELVTFHFCAGISVHSPALKLWWPSPPSLGWWPLTYSGPGISPVGRSGLLRGVLTGGRQNCDPHFHFFNSVYTRGIWFITLVNFRVWWGFIYNTDNSLRNIFNSAHQCLKEAYCAHMHEHTYTGFVIIHNRTEQELTSVVKLHKRQQRYKEMKWMNTGRKLFAHDSFSISVIISQS